jgi:hypothetical protein
MSKLRLHIPKRIENQGLTEDKVPADMKEEVQDADVTLNHSILLAEIFDLDFADALESINQVSRSAINKSGLFVKEDFEDLLQLFGEIKSQMKSRLSSDGHQKSMENAFTDQYFEEDENGRVCFKSHKVPVIYFMEDLEHISTLFDYALKNDIFVEYLI